MTENQYPSIPNIKKSVINFESVLEDKDAIMSLDKVKELIKNEFLNVSNSTKLEDIDVKFHSYSDRGYDFYVTVKRSHFKNNSSDECIEYDENYRLKEKEVIQIVNNYLKEFKLKLKQNDSDKVYHFSLRTNSNPETRDDIEFFYRFEELKEEKYSH